MSCFRPVLRLVFAVFLVAVAPFDGLAQAPPNDNFVNRATITGMTNTVTGSNVAATKESFEPNHGGNAGGKSVWWTWTAPTAGLVTIDTIGSAFDTTLGVYTGNSVGGLTLKAGDNDSAGAQKSRVSFNTVAGAVYQIGVDGFNGANGSVTLNLSQQPAPANDSFASRITISGMTNSVTGSNVAATKESGEPSHGGNAGGKSVWWTWTAPANGLVTMDTIGSDFDTTLGVYTGTSVGSLTLKAGDDNSAGSQKSRVSFFTIAGVVYQIAVDGFTGANGGIVLNISQQPAPQNDDFANRITIAGLTNTVTGNSTAASKQTGEPNHADYFGGKSVWWTWTAPVTGLLTLDTIGSSFNTVLAIYTGTAVNSMSTINYDDDSGGAGTSRFTQSVLAGTTYLIAVDGVGGVGGDIILNLSLQPAAPNDNFADRIAITGMTNTVTGHNTLATREAGEPFHANYYSTKSVWWKWTAPTNGLVTLDTAGTGFDTLLAVYTGAAVDSLTEVASNNDAPGLTTSLLTFIALPGTEYQFAVDSADGTTTGPITINLRQTPPSPPGVSIAPGSSNTVAGLNVRFTATATGTPPLGYQWYHGATLLPGQTASDLILNGVTPGQGGTYRCVVTNSLGAVTNSAILTVAPLLLTVDPVSTNIPTGDSVTFTANVTSYDFIVGAGYRWLLGGTQAVGVADAPLTLDNVQPNQAGTYWVIATNGYGAVTGMVTLTVTLSTIVSSANDSGPFTLRSAILAANASPGLDTITFNLPAGVNTITLASRLPAITDPVVIDGASQPGFAGSPLIVLRANGSVASRGPLLRLSAGGSTVRSLALKEAAGSSSNPPDTRGDAIAIENGGTNVIAGCHIGTDAAGLATAFNNGVGVFITNSVGNRIGGTTAADRNVIAANLGGDIIITGAGSSNNTVAGNWVGLDARGTNVLNRRSVQIDGAVGNFIGGPTTGHRNVLVGGTSGAVWLRNNASGNTVQGNFIGIAATGEALVPVDGTSIGVLVEGPANAILNNVISGNGDAGIRFGFNGNRSGNTVQGNLIGTDPTGIRRIANGSGIMLFGDHTRVGGATAAARNLISGNTGNNLYLGGNSNVVQGNFIGTDSTGNAPLPGGASASGVSFYQGGGTGNLIGGTGAGERNVIAGSNTNGIVGGGGTNQIIGNFIGVGADGTIVLGNAARGLYFYGEGSDCLISSNLIAGHSVSAVYAGYGATSALAQRNRFVANTVFNNPGKGFVLTGFGGNDLDRNALFSNSGLAIDRFNDGPTANNPAGDINNSPVLTNAVATDSAVLIEGYLRAEVGQTYTIQFFLNPPADAAPQAREFLGETNITISQVTPQSLRISRIVPQSGPPQGTVKIGNTFYRPSAAGSKVTTVSRVNGNPSELSGLITVSQAPPASAPPTVAQAPNASTLGDPISGYSGELHDQKPADLDLGGPMPLRFARYYAAFLRRDNLIAGKLGDNWLHNFEWTLTTTASNTVRVVNSMGRLIEFTNTGAGYVLIGLLETPFQLTSSGGNFILGDPRSQRLHTFDNTGKLIQIADTRGNTHTLAYAGNQLASVSDGLGRSLTFSYSAGGALTNVSDGTRNVAFTRTGNNLTAVGSPLGFTTTYSYDTGNANPGLLTATTRPTGTVPWAQVFDAQGRVVSQTDGGQHTATMAYSGNTTTYTNPRGAVQTDVHTASGDHLSFTDESGLTIALGYNAARQRNIVTDRLGDTIGIAYHAPSGQPSAVTNADGTLTQFTYVARTNSGVVFYDTAQVTYPDGAVESFTYDAGGNVLTRTDRAGKVWTFTYNARGQLLTARNPTGGTTTFTYDSNGNLASRRDSDTGTTTYAYDAFSRMTNLVHPDGATMRMTWDANDRLISTTDERGNTSTFTYDNNGNVIRVTDALGNSTGFAYDARDRVIRSTNRLGQVAARVYGPLDQLIAVTNRNGNVTTYTYDARRRLTAVTDAAGRTWSRGYDNEDIPIAATNPLGQTSTSGTDKLGYPVTATNALGHVTRVVRDALRRVTATVDGIGRTNTFGYDARGLLTSAGKPVIGTAGYQRNDLGLLARITDLNGSQWNFSRTAMGRETGRTDPLNRAQSMTYDSRGRPLRTVFPDGVTCTNSYDAAGNVIRRTYSDGTDYQFTYDALNRLVSANGLAFSYDAEGRLTNTASSGVNYAATYDAGGRLTSVSYHNGAFTVNYTYDSRDRLTRVTDTLTGTQLDFAYDDAGRMTSLTRPNGVNGSYTYDAAGRLTRIQEGAIIDLQFGFDAARQLTSVNHTAPINPAVLHHPAAQTHTHDAAHQISTPGHAYDARGRQTAAPGHSFQWDGASRLKQIDAVTLAYDGANNLQTRTAGGVTVRYFYNHALGLAPIMAERNETTSQMQRYYIWTPGGRLLYAIDPANGNAVSHYHFDQIGTTLALTAANGTVTDAYAYTPYGVLLGRTGSSTQPFTYVGRYGVRAEPTAELHHMRARYYLARGAAFLSRDPIGPKLANLQSLLPYHYAAQNPLSQVDPRGMESEEAIKQAERKLENARRERSNAEAKRRAEGLDVLLALGFKERDFNDNYDDGYGGGLDASDVGAIVATPAVPSSKRMKPGELSAPGPEYQGSSSDQPERLLTLPRPFKTKPFHTNRVKVALQDLSEAIWGLKRLSSEIKQKAWASLEPE